MRRVITKDGIKNYVKIMRRLFIAFTIVMFPAMLISLAFAFNGYIAFMIIAPALIVLFLTGYVLYAHNVTLSVVLEMEITDKVLHIKTKRKTFTYDVNMSCTQVKTYRRKFVATFETQDSRDKFTFYRKVWFTKYYEEQFSADEIRLFFPALDEEEM